MSCSAETAAVVSDSRIRVSDSDVLVDLEKGSSLRRVIAFLVCYRGSTSFRCEELTCVSSFGGFRRRSVDFAGIRTAASGGESLVGVGRRGSFWFRRRCDENGQGLSITVFGGC